MKVFINDIEKTIPGSLSEFTLGQRIAFHQQHGKELEKILASIMQMEDGPHKEVEIMEFQFEKAFRSFSFFTGVPLNVVKESKFINDVYNIYHITTNSLLDDEQQLEPERSFIWKDEEWVIDSPVLKHGDKMKFGELIDAKQIVKDMVELGNGKWEYMLPLCAIFLRKKGESYQQEFTYEGSDRMELMKELPMNIAMQVGFFLSSSMNFYLNTSTSSESQELKAEGNIPESILTGTAG